MIGTQIYIYNFSYSKYVSDYYVYVGTILRKKHYGRIKKRS